MKKLLICILPILFLSSCLGGGDASVTQDISYYKNLWKETFRSYQASTTKIPKKGKFDFQFTSMATGSWQSLNQIGGIDLGEKFSSLSVALLGEHDFENTDHPSLDATLKIYLNRRAFGAGDVDITFRIDGSGSVVYSLNNIDGKTLAFLWLPKETVEELVLAYDEHPGQEQRSDTRAEFLKEIMLTLAESEKNNPLVENTKSEEERIIDAFLSSEVVEILSGSTVENNVARLSFKLNSDNLIKFLDQVAQILGGENANKRFDGNRKFLDAFTVAWTMDISNKRIVDSKILSEVPVSFADKDTGTEKYELFASENRFVFPNPERFDFGWTTLFYTKSSPGNKIQFELKWLIK